MQNIIDTAIAAGSFKTLAAALTAAGLVDTLKSAGPFTVFAPTDDAFAKLPEGTVDKLLKDVPKLKAILTYHVLSGKVMAADVMKIDGKTAKTVNGADLKISTQGGVKLNGSVHVTKTDIDCSNGVIHVVDAVLMPPA
ncbi:MAG: fasciclin domain-containing protein [Polaromonas sp.]|uniref:fasciclin domain-containing protein n=1 Tax=Polaromonas sp. TaxID=1869339 RepID=UPI0018580010|nr:fasciclin domain-containing protein [Polaromonas sp.]NMM09289.1 fasciclin domain-containing protein [Polaromonas sp.]